MAGQKKTHLVVHNSMGTVPDKVLKLSALGRSKQKNSPVKDHRMQGLEIKNGSADCITK